MSALLLFVHLFTSIVLGIYAVLIPLTLDGIRAWLLAPLMIPLMSLWSPIVSRWSGYFAIPILAMLLWMSIADTGRFLSFRPYLAAIDLL